MTVDEVRIRARERFKGICRVCKFCDGVACAGEVPGMGGVGTGTSFKNNIKALEKYRVNLRVIHDITEPVIRTQIFGKELSMPILGAAVAGGKINFRGYFTEEEFVSSQIEGAVSAGTIAMTGDGGDPTLFTTGLESLKNAGCSGIPVIKPRKTRDIIKRIKDAEKFDITAIGIDIDAAGLINMTRMGQYVGPMTVSDLKEITSSTKLPVVLKGIMTVEDALAAVEAGIAGIVVSNHGGRALDFTPGTAEVLPEIADAVKGKITILADGGVRYGIDVLKMIALGADAVLIGRPVAIAAVGGGARGVEMVYNKMADELRSAMILTGCKDVNSIDRKILR
jgi:isopentenyl diphosphate isomerase/L-lactate dehydrogenase-like FMN-dependent dehydrogenase